jgi:DNA-binding LacI/PurR family transcriptional regulator
MNIKKPVRLADVARAAGVSQGTASNVFNRPELVRPEVRARVAEAARRLGYGGPDPKGRMLRAGRVNAIGVVMADDLPYFFRDPFARRFLAGLADVCQKEGAGLALVSATRDSEAAWNIQSAVVDGLVVYCLEDDNAELVEMARRRAIPFVAVDVEAGIGASSIRIDDRGGCAAAARHLLAEGHRRIAVLSLELLADGRTGFVAPERRRRARYRVTRDRLAGYADACAEFGIDFDAVPIVETFNTPEDGAAAMRLLLDRHPDVTAVLCMSDALALAAIAVARERGLAVPAAMSVVGFDDIPEAALAEPPLTTVAQPIEEKGRIAGELIFASGPPRNVVLDIHLVVRGSTAPPPGAGPVG